MLILYVESMKNAKIYRKLQLGELLQFEGLEYVLAAVFELLDEHPEKSYFHVVRSAGKEITPQVITYSPNSDTEMSTMQTKLEDWLKEPGDEVQLFINDEYEIKVLLEQQLTDSSLKMQCLEGAGNIKTNQVEKIDLHEINGQIESMNLFGTFENKRPAQFQQLLQVASELNKVKPWKYFENKEILVFELKEEEVKFFVSVMGAEGLEYGLLLYDEHLGYASLMKVLKQEPLSEDYTLNLSALVINYVDRDDLDEEDYILIKENGFSFRGKNNWIQFRAYFPGVFPTLPDADEVEMLIAVGRAMLQLVEQRKNGWNYPENLRRNEFPYFDITLDGQIEEDKILEIKPEPQNKLFIEINDIEKMQFKRKPKLAIILEFELMYFPFPVPTDVGEEHLIYPLMLVVLNRQTGEVIANDLLPFPKLPEFCQEVFWRLLLELPNRVDTFYVTKEMKDILEPVAKRLNIQLVASELTAITNLKYLMEQHTPFDFEED